MGLLTQPLVEICHTIGEASAHLSELLHLEHAVAVQVEVPPIEGVCAQLVHELVDLLSWHLTIHPMHVEQSTNGTLRRGLLRRWLVSSASQHKQHRQRHGDANHRSARIWAGQQPLLHHLSLEPKRYS
mmetsp:Transcript_2343/g.1886  ORF Transcript_2343/g.1886 Transcript_2343/m.1886 type:complete len:128 (+) Transcript_2343:146-529(+)